MNVTEYIDDEIRQMEAIAEPVALGQKLSNLKGCYFFCKGTNKRMRDLARWPMENGSFIRITDDCEHYEIIADAPVKSVRSSLCPSIVISPSVGERNPSNRLKSVVLPAPDVPLIPIFSPLRIVRSILRSVH